MTEKELRHENCGGKIEFNAFHIRCMKCRKEINYDIEYIEVL